MGGQGVLKAKKKIRTFFFTFFFTDKASLTYDTCYNQFAKIHWYENDTDCQGEFLFIG